MKVFHTQQEFLARQPFLVVWDSQAFLFLFSFIVAKMLLDSASAAFSSYAWASGSATDSRGRALERAQSVAHEKRILSILFIIIKVL